MKLRETGRPPLELIAHLRDGAALVVNLLDEMPPDPIVSNLHRHAALSTGAVDGGV
jgi:hypothetical protein